MVCTRRAAPYSKLSHLKAVCVLKRCATNLPALRVLPLRGIALACAVRHHQRVADLRCALAHCAALTVQMWTFPGSGGGGGGGGGGSGARRPASSKPRKTRSKDLSHYSTFGEVPRNHIVELLFHMERAMNPVHLETATPEELYACFYMASGKLPSRRGRSCLGALGPWEALVAWGP